MVSTDKQPAVVILQPSALPLAQKIAAQINGKVHGPDSSAASVVFGKFPEHLTALFVAGHPIIAICAAGILVRILGRKLTDKRNEPPVIAVSEDGASIVPVIGGHNGANRLATEIAPLTKGTPAITTASDTAFGVPLDDPPPGYTLANREHIKPFVTAMLTGSEVSLDGKNAWLQPNPAFTATGAPPSLTLPPGGERESKKQSPLPHRGGGLGRGGSPAAHSNRTLTPLARNLRKTQTEPERLLWSKLRAHRFMGLQFRRQHQMGNYIADFCCHAHKLIIEVDGWTHSTDAETSRDQERDTALAAHGFTTLRFSNDEVMTNIEGVLTTIANHIATGAPPSLTLPPEGERESKTPSPLPQRGGGLGRGGSPTTHPLRVTTTIHPTPGTPTRLVYHPHTLTLGVGCERGTSSDELIAHIDATLTAHNLAPHSIAGIFSLDLKSDETAIHALAGHLNRPTRFFTAVELNAEAKRLANPSETVHAEVGCPGVAEGAALAAAGPDSTLIVEKTKSARATCAIAEAPAPLITLPGTPQGRLFVVGLGPGTPDWRSPAATRALETATDWVGYGLYLDLAADLLHSQTEHRFPLGDEEPRVRHAIALAAEGRDVALICSGDAGIYAMAALVYEVLDIAPERIAVDVIPGISAFQAAAARAGALIGHDFCCISLSDLLTPWQVIETRLHAAAEGDFVTAFYNPRSQRRTTQLERAIEIFTPHRTPDTPVVIASNLGRPTEAVKIVPLSAFKPADVDMLTLVMIGSSQSKTLTRGDGNTFAYTPRGYAKKRDSQ